MFIFNLINLYTLDIGHFRAITEPSCFQLSYFSRCSQVLGKDFASSSKLFELANTLPSPYQVPSISLATLSEVFSLQTP